MPGATRASTSGTARKRSPSKAMRSVKAVFLWPVIFVVAVIDGCYDVLWYSLIVGRPAWMKGRNPIRELATLLGRTR